MARPFAVQRPDLRFPVQPRLVPANKAARRLHLRIDEFRAVLPDLRKEGFPAPCPVTGHFDLVAMDAWFDRRAGLAGATPIERDREATMRERIASIG